MWLRVWRRNESNGSRRGKVGQANRSAIEYGFVCVIKTRSSADADNGLDAFSSQSNNNMWYHFRSIATFR